MKKSGTVSFYLLLYRLKKKEKKIEVEDNF